MIPLSTGLVATQLNLHLGINSVTAEKVLALVVAGALTNIGSGRSIRISDEEVLLFASRVRFVTPSQWPTQSPIFRVSLLGIREDKIVDNAGRVLRTHAGADYSGGSGLSQDMAELAWTGAWKVSDKTVQHAVSMEAILVGTTKGYVDPKYVRQIVGAHRTPSGSRICWETRAAPEDVMNFVGAGLWMDVKPGRESDWA